MNCPPDRKNKYFYSFSILYGKNLTPSLQKKIISPWISFIFTKTCTFKKSGYDQVPTMFSNIFELLHRSEKVVYHKTKIKLKSSWNLQNSNGIFTVASRTYSPGVCFRSQVFYPHRIVKSNRHTYTHTYTDTDTHRNINTHSHTYTHSHTHTHTHARK